MAIGWHYERDGEQHGPVEFDQLKRMASSGLLRDHDLVWSEGMSGWDQASRISGLFSPKTAEWYFAVGGERFGPVFLDDLKQFAIGGRLLPSDLVWSQGEPNWKPAAEVPSLINDLRHGEATPASKGKIQRIKELAASDESRMIMERTKNAASDISGKVREVAKKAKDYASSDDAKELLDKAKRNISDVTEKIAHSERTKAIVDFTSTIPEKWQENASVLGLPMKDWGCLAALLVLAVILKLANAATSGYLVVYAMCSLWVYRDARTRLNSPVGWSAGTLLAGFLVMPVYIALRNLKEGETREGGRSWNILRCFAIFWTITMAVAALSFLGGTSEINSTATNEFERAGVTIGTGIGFMMLAAFWFFPMVAALVLGLFLKQSTALERGPTGLLATYPPYPTLRKSSFIGIGVVGLLIIGVLSSSPPKPSLEDHSGMHAGQDRSASGGGEASDKVVAEESGASQTGSSTATTTGPFVYNIEHIKQLKLKCRAGFRDEAIMDVMSNDLQVTNLDQPIKVTVIDHRPDYTIVRIEEDRPELAARAMSRGTRMYVPNPKNW